MKYKICLLLCLGTCGCNRTPKTVMYDEGDDFFRVTYSASFSNVCCTAQFGGKWIMIPGTGVLPYQVEKK